MSNNKSLSELNVVVQLSDFSLMLYYVLKQERHIFSVLCKQ